MKQESPLMKKLMAVKTPKERLAILDADLATEFETPPTKHDPLAGWTGAPKMHLDKSPDLRKKP